MADWLDPPRELVDDPLQRPEGIEPEPDEFDEPEQEEAWTPQDAVVARAKQRKAERQSRLGIPQEPEPEQEASQKPQEPQQRDEEEGVAELLRQLLDATRAATDATEATTEAVQEMGGNIVSALSDLKTAIDELNTGLE